MDDDLCRSQFRSLPTAGYHHLTEGSKRLVHVFSALVWLPLTAVHSLAHLLELPRRLADDWRDGRGSRSRRGRGLRLGVNLGALLLGVIAAVLLFPAASPLFAWSQTHEIGMGPFLVGTG